MVKGRLEHWAVYRGLFVEGEVYEHADYDDQSSIRTSMIQAFDPETKVLTTQTASEYLLGKPHAYSEVFAEEAGYADPFEWLKYLTTILSEEEDKDIGKGDPKATLTDGRFQPPPVGRDWGPGKD